jgi:hypothetical protein
MVGDELIRRCIDRVRHEIPDVVAVLTGGSVVRGDAGPHSDVDLDVIVANGPRDEWPNWYLPEGGGLVRIDLWVRDADSWLAAGDEPQDWAFGLPSVDPLRLCWVADESWRTRLDRDGMAHPAGPPELAHVVSDLAKVANARVRGDELGLRLAALDLATALPGLLRPVHPGPPVTSRRAALDAALATGPAGDLLTCLGLTGAATVADVHAAATRLAADVVDLLETRRADYADVLSKAERDDIVNGNLRRYVSQLVAE